MKKTLIVFLAAALLLSLCACGGAGDAKKETQAESTYAVKNPMAWPDYSVPENPTPEQLRAIVVRAMRDELSVKWCAEKFMKYDKEGSVSGKAYSYVPEVTFSGLPYSNGGTGLIQWMAHYDQKTGMLHFDGDGQKLNETLGNSCANSVCWAYSTVCNSLGGAFNTYTMTRKYGFLPVGPYTYEFGLEDYNSYTTDKIAADNGDDVMLESYACILPGDALVSSPDGHAVMAIEAANTVRGADGKIDPKSSYVIIQDQRAGEGDYFYEVEENGETQLYHGRLDHKYTFAELLKLAYLPCCPAELAGTKAYEKPSVKLEGSTDSVDRILDGKLVSNYLACNVKAILTDENGNDTQLALIHFSKTSTGKGTADRYSLDKLKQQLSDEIVKENMKSGKNYQFRLDVDVADGQTFTIAKIDMKK